jgi:hypothetical protein
MVKNMVEITPDFNEDKYPGLKMGTVVCPHCGKSDKVYFKKLRIDNTDLYVVCLCQCRPAEAFQIQLGLF